MTAPTLNAIDLTACENISADKNGNIIPLPMPTGDSDETEVFDMLGVTKIISVRGKFTGTDVATVKAKIDAIEALIDGDQSATVDFVSDQTGTIAVKVASIKSNWDVPGFKCEYDIKIIQGV